MPAPGAMLPGGGERCLSYCHMLVFAPQSGNSISALLEGEEIGLVLRSPDLSEEGVTGNLSRVSTAFLTCTSSSFPGGVLCSSEGGSVERASVPARRMSLYASPFIKERKIKNVKDAAKGKLGFLFCVLWTGRERKKSYGSIEGSGW